VRRPKLPAAWAAQARFLTRPPSVPGSVEPAKAERRTGVDFETDWARRGPARAVRKVLHETVMEAAVQVLARPTVLGVDRLAALDEDRPVIFAANHHSHADTTLLMRTVPQPWRDKLFVAAAADYFFPNRLAGFASALVLNAIPLERTKVSRRSAVDAAANIDDGWSLVIYPEGGRSPDGWGQPFRGGAAYLALKCAVPVVPVYITGTETLLPKGASYPTPTRTTVTFGAPLHAVEGEDSRRLNLRIEAAVNALADEATTDWYTAKRRAYAKTTPPLTGPEGAPWRRAWERTANEVPAASRRWPKV
jgi:1-acyl-sn-glycerol-3-phosphate acyltransferase